MALMTVGAVISCEKPATSDEIPTQPEVITPIPKEPGEAETTPPRDLITTESAQEQVKGGLREFSFNIFREAAKTSDAKSFMISPLSLATALAMTEGGAAGTTAEEMKSVLGFPDATQDDFAAYFKDISNKIHKADSNVAVKVANSIWSDTKFPVLDEFKDFSEYFYEAAVRSRDFKQPSAADEINAWCSEKTDGKIPSITTPDKLRELCMCLINALYFNAKWSYDFGEAIVRTFHCYDGSQRGVPLISKTSSFASAYVDGVRFVEIPYGNGSFVFDVILPKEGDDIFNFIANMTGDRFSSLVSSAKPVMMFFSMPTFKMEYTAEKFIDNLKAIGMEKAFDPNQADFSAISQVSTFISTITQKTYIYVTETGTEAAAVTSMGVAASSIDLDVPIAVIVDRPYIFAIREKSTDTILFIGAMTDGVGEYPVDMKDA